jgi:hypothetical protein
MWSAVNVDAEMEMVQSARPESGVITCEFGKNAGRGPDADVDEPVVPH